MLGLLHGAVIVNGPRQAVIDEDYVVPDEYTVFDRHALADKRMTADLALRSYLRAPLYFNKCPNLGVVSDLTTVKVNEVVYSYAFSHHHVCGNLLK
jgi:hypothetical protein